MKEPPKSCKTDLFWLSLSKSGLPRLGTGLGVDWFERNAICHDLRERYTCQDWKTAPAAPRLAKHKGHKCLFFFFFAPHPWWGDGVLVTGKRSCHGRSVPPGGGFGRESGVRAGKSPQEFEGDSEAAARSRRAMERCTRGAKAAAKVLLGWMAILLPPLRRERSHFLETSQKNLLY